MRRRPGQTPADRSRGRSRGTGGPSAPGRHGPAGPSHEHDRHHGPGSSAPPGDGAGGGRGHGHRQACRALHLPTICRRIQEMAAYAMRQRSSYKDFLAHLLEAECAEREDGASSGWSGTPTSPDPSGWKTCLRATPVRR
ncbi:ATP-binding protein [Streptomyces sp. NPDC048309]|uniref:ATP-binding protein n=1 Tax=Streptomyces sp. NPDC048309 TaxID=3154618 RepID=UPI00341048BC